MKLDKKLEYAVQSVKSIATHDDASSKEQEATLDALVKAVKAEKKKIRKRKKDRFLDRVGKAFKVLVK